MNADLSPLVVSVTKPKGKPAKMLADAGILVLPVAEDEGNVDRYILSKRLAVERRTGSGFLQGIMDKTLFTSAIYLRERFDLPALIVEGDADGAGDLLLGKSGDLLDESCSIDKTRCFIENLWSCRKVPCNFRSNKTLKCRNLAC